MKTTILTKYWRNKEVGNLLSQYSERRVNIEEPNEAFVPACYFAS